MAKRRRKNETQNITIPGEVVESMTHAVEVGTMDTVKFEAGTPIFDAMMREQYRGHDLVKE